MPMPELAGLMQDKTATDEGFRIRARLSHDFVLQHHANAWEVDSEGLSGPTWLPVLSPRIMQAGANGIRTIGDNEDKAAAYTAALRSDQDQGVFTLPRDLRVSASFLPDGVSEGRYVRSLDAVDPRTRVKGSCHVSAWRVPQDVPPGQSHTFKFHRAEFNKWRAHLVESGVIQPPSESVKAKLIRKHDARVLSAEVDPLPDEVRKRRVKEKAEIRDSIKSAKSPKAKSPRAVK